MSPTPRQLALWLLWLLPAIYVSFVPEQTQAWMGFSAILIAALLADALSLRIYPQMQCEREVKTALALGQWTSVELRFVNRGRLSQRIQIFDHHPPVAEQEGLPHSLRVPGGGWGRLTYRTRPLMRGSFEFGQVEYRLHSFLGLWYGRRRGGAPSRVRVYPDFANVMKFSLLATDQRLSQMGILKRRRRGEGLEFHQLREYREGDSLRQIDWNATARLRRIISRDYTEERDQQVIFLVDCGRRMLSQDDKLTHFDHTLNAILLLSHVALRQGDAVGLMTFSGDERWLPPQKSMATANHILNNIFDLQPGLMAPDYPQAVTRLMAQQRRRALVILITNLKDEDAAELVPALHILRKRHLVLLASMKERVIEQTLSQPIESFEEALKFGATEQYLAYRGEMHRTLNKTGILHFDVIPDQLPVSIVNRYLEIKSSGSL